MYVKLAFRNVKRQISNYLIYFITVCLTVALMFAVDNVIFSEAFQGYADQYNEFKAGLIGITVFVAVIVAFVLGYANSFMLKLRKREFGTYLALGMKRKDILSIFISETMIMCLAALAAGMVLGLFTYQGLMALLSKLLETEVSFAPYSAQGTLFTAAIVLLVFLLSSFTSAMYLKKISVYELLRDDRAVQKEIKFPRLWLVVAVLSLAAIIVSSILFSQCLYNSFLGEEVFDGKTLLLCIGVFAVSVILFHIALSRSATNMLLKNKKYCAKGTRTFMLRQLSAKLNSNSVMIGMLSFLMVFAIIGSNVSVVLKVSENASLNKRHPFDISAQVDEEAPSSIGLNEAEKIIEKYSKINYKIPYTIYESDNDFLHSFTKWSGDGYEGLNDMFISQSDFNKLMKALGKQTVSLDNEYLILANYAHIANCDFSQAALKLNGKDYTFAGVVDDTSLYFYAYFIAVVPDEAILQAAPAAKCMVYDLEKNDFDAAALREELTYEEYAQEDDFSYRYERCDYTIKEYEKIQRNSNSAVFVVGALYVAAVFVFMSMSMLALKTLSGISEDKNRYSILYRLGASEKQRVKTLFWQIFIFFLLPFVFPAVFSLPVGIVCANIMRLAGYSAQAAGVFANSIIIAVIIAAIYLLYFAATYLIAKRCVILDDEGR